MCFYHANFGPRAKCCRNYEKEENIRASMLLQKDVFCCLLAEFPALTPPTFTSVVAKHGVEHPITTTGLPVHAQRLAPAKLAIAKEEFYNMERRSSNP